MKIANINSILLNTDSYKCSHWLQYPPGTENVFSYIESRGGKYDQTLFFGLQSALKEYLTTPITQQDIEEASQFLKIHGEPFNHEGWEYILNKHGGLLPISVKAIPEGTIIPTGNVLVTVEATDPNCFWVVSYIETLLLRAIWYGTTVATQSWNIKQTIKKFLEETGNPSELSFKLHDFGSRGVSSFESAGLGGAAHLVNFVGTDTITGILYAMKYYNSDIVGFSIPAMEHSSVTSWGRSNEVLAFSNMMDCFGGKNKIVACVSDSYDIFNAVEHIWGEELREKVLTMGGRVVIRPDSSIGHPSEVINKIIVLLDEKFGSTVNSKGYKVLHPAVRIIQGDGVNQESITVILEELKRIGYSADNILFGMGGGLLQQINRDTCKFAYKASSAKINGNWIDVYKDPITDPGKRSKKGRLKLIKQNNKSITVREDDTKYNDQPNVLREVFLNGKLLIDDTFDNIKQRSES